MRHHHRISRKSGLPPGSVVYVGKEHMGHSSVDLVDYTEKHLIEKSIGSITDTYASMHKKSVTWLRITGVHNTDIISKFGAEFNLHHLVIEDIANTDQRPKVEDYGNYIFVVAKILRFDEITKHVKAEQVSCIITERFLLTFQEHESNIFEPIMQQIRREERIRSMGTDYLLYTILDLIVDQYFDVLERVEEEIELLEEKVIKDPTPNTPTAIYNLKRQLMVTQKYIWPLREVASILHKGASPIIKKSTREYLRDVEDHILRAMQTVDSGREMITYILEAYVSTINLKMNEVMKVLTVITTIFIPLSFIASMYGMNFDYMPELHMKWFYPMVWAAVITIASIMFFYFKKKKWL